MVKLEMTGYGFESLLAFGVMRVIIKIRMWNQTRWKKIKSWSETPRLPERASCIFLLITQTSLYPSTKWLGFFTFNNKYQVKHNSW